MQLGMISSHHASTTPSGVMEEGLVTVRQQYGSYGSCAVHCHAFASLLATADPVNEEDAAREGAYPFTTITPNVGRGFIALPDPSPLLGLSPDQVQPAYGFAPGLDISRVQDAGCSNIGPLMQLVKDCGWQQQQQPVDCSGPCGDGVLWRRVPVVVKDVAGLVPGEEFVQPSTRNSAWLQIAWHGLWVHLARKRLLARSLRASDLGPVR